jgi:hypothetical protein
VVVWDVAALVKGLPAVAKAGAADAGRLWDTLAGADAVKAGDAVWRLAAAPDHAVLLLKDRLPKAAPEKPNPGVGKLLAELDDDDYAVREKATQELIRLGPSTVSPVSRALATTTSREVRRRAEEVLAKLGVDPGTDPEKVRLARGVEILQRIGTAEARGLLESWADGPPASPLGREARTALAMMGSRHGR